MYHYPVTISGLWSMTSSRWLRRVLASASLMGIGACAPSSPLRSYVPRTREITVTTVPLLVRESQAAFPFLKVAFAPRGVLEGKEVYAFVPSTITVMTGDTIAFSFVNPEDDLHNFVLGSGDLTVPLPGNHLTHATYVARTSGIVPFFCSVPSHYPMMAGQLVVLPDGVGGRH